MILTVNLYSFKPCYKWITFNTVTGFESLADENLAMF